LQSETNLDLMPNNRNGIAAAATRAAYTAAVGDVITHPVVRDARALRWLANQNCITPHVWTSRAPRLFHPDMCVVDLDPSREDAGALRSASLGVRALLAELGLASAVKTSGSKGFHVVVPLDAQAGFDVVSRFSSRLAAELVARDPERLTLAFTKAERGGRIYVDVGRNGPGATIAAPYAVRARPGAPVSAPCTWDEVASGEVGPRTFNLRTMAARVGSVRDVWADMRGQSLAEAVERLPAGPSP
jgi:bifunctional non-homologous end joining protein LigD